MRGPAVLGLLSVMVAGCVLSPIDPSGRSCDERDQCLEGWRCELTSRTCVPAEGLDAGVRNDASTADAPGLDAFADDAAGLDAPGLDAAGPDAAHLDAPLTPTDTGGLDAGTSSDDAAVPACEPACVPGVERCAATGCELLDRTPLTSAPAPVLVTLGPAYYELGSEIDLDFGALTTLEGRAVDEIDVIRVPPRAGGVPYDLCRFRNLPARPAARPLVIASTGGRVVCRLGAMTGGSHWVLTGRHDTALGVGDASTPGHDEGYANTRGRYGWEFLTSVSVTSTIDGAQMELDHIEVSGRVATSGAQVDVVANLPATLWLHDAYVHDGAGVGVQFGGAAPTRAIVTRSRILRSGEGCLVGRGVQDGTLVRNDVLAACNLGARAIGTQFFGDAAMTLEARTGLVRLEDLVVAAAHGSALYLLDTGAAADGRVTFALEDVVVDEVANHPLLLRATDGAELDAVLRGRRLRFAVSRWSWDAVEPTEMLPGEPPLISTIVGAGTSITLEDVHWDPGVYTRVVPLGYSPPVTGPTPLDVAGADFVDFMAGVDAASLELWHAEFLRPDADGGAPDPRPRTFESGAVVTHLGLLYRAMGSPGPTDVPGASGSWVLLAPQPSDDVSLVSSEYETWGVGL